MGRRLALAALLLLSPAITLAQPHTMSIHSGPSYRDRAPHVRDRGPHIRTNSSVRS